MSLNLKQARASIKERILQVQGLDHVHSTQLPKGFKPPRNAYDEVEPYAVARFGRPVPDFGRTIGDGEQDYPHTWPVGVFVYAMDGDQALDLVDELDALMLDWSPDGDNSTGFRGGPSYSYDFPSTDNMPARIEIQRYYTCLVNLQR